MTLKLRRLFAMIGITFPYKLEQGKTYKCKIRLRKTFKGSALKPEVLSLNGEVLNLKVRWLCQDSDLYAGEWAMGSPGLYDELFDMGHISWIASGDVKVIQEVTDEP